MFSALIVVVTFKLRRVIDRVLADCWIAPLHFVDVIFCSDDYYICWFKHRKTIKNSKTANFKFLFYEIILNVFLNTQLILDKKWLTNVCVGEVDI